MLVGVLLVAVGGVGVGCISPDINLPGSHADCRDWGQPGREPFTDTSAGMGEIFDGGVHTDIPECPSTKSEDPYWGQGTPKGSAFCGANCTEFDSVASCTLYPVCRAQFAPLQLFQLSRYIECTYASTYECR
jgi:hypothetical protein